MPCTCYTTFPLASSLYPSFTFSLWLVFWNGCFLQTRRNLEEVLLLWLKFKYNHHTSYKFQRRDACVVVILPRYPYFILQKPLCHRRCCRENRFLSKYILLISISLSQYNTRCCKDIITFVEYYLRKVSFIFILSVKWDFAA